MLSPARIMTKWHCVIRISQTSCGQRRPPSTDTKRIAYVRDAIGFFFSFWLIIRCSKKRNLKVFFYLFWSQFAWSQCSFVQLCDFLHSNAGAVCFTETFKIGLWSELKIKDNKIWIVFSLFFDAAIYESSIFFNAMNHCFSHIKQTAIWSLWHIA